MVEEAAQPTARGALGERRVYETLISPTYSLGIDSDRYGSECH